MQRRLTQATLGRIKISVNRREIKQWTANPDVDRIGISCRLHFGERGVSMLEHIFPVLLFAALAGYFLVKGLKERSRSRRFANLALFFGLTVLVQPELALGLPFANRTMVHLASGGLRVILGLVAITLAIAAYRTRQESEVGKKRIVFGAIIGLLSVLIGGLILLESSSALPTSPWPYQSPDGAYQLILPSSKWKQVPIPGGKWIASFARVTPRMNLLVLNVRQNQFESDWQQSIESFRARAENNPELCATAAFREGPTPGGNRYYYCAGMDPGTNGKRVFVVLSAIWSPREHTVVELLFEGLPSMLSESMRVVEMEAMREAAQRISLSVTTDRKAEREVPAATADPAAGKSVRLPEDVSHEPGREVTAAGKSLTEAELLRGRKALLRDALPRFYAEKKRVADELASLDRKSLYHPESLASRSGISRNRAILRKWATLVEEDSELLKSFAAETRTKLVSLAAGSSFGPTAVQDFDKVMDQARELQARTLSRMEALITASTELTEYVAARIRKVEVAQGKLVFADQADKNGYERLNAKIQSASAAAETMASQNLQKMKSGFDELLN